MMYYPIVYTIIVLVVASILGVLLPLLFTHYLIFSTDSTFITDSRESAYTKTYLQQRYDNQEC